MKSMVKFALASAVSLIALDASAGGFGVREQSTTSQGASFAGAATSAGGLSGMYWNPAVLGEIPGINTEKHAAGIFAYGKLTPTTGTGPLNIGRGDSGNLGVPALVGASYASYQVNDRLFLGISVNAPYGLRTKSDYSWAGQFYGRSSDAFNMTATPTVAYRLNDWFTLGAGVQISYFDVNLKASTPALPGAGNVLTAFSPVAPNNILTGDSWGIGYTLGAMIKPAAGTEIGIGFRSSVHFDLEGQLQLPYALMPIKAKLNLPETVTVGLKQKLGQNVTLLAGLEWQNWSRLNRPAIRHGITGTAINEITFVYQDGWMFSLGGEYRWNEKLTLRAGLGYEISPVTDAVRSVRIPDNDRTWASLGASYKWNEQISLDAAYTHVFVKDPDVRIVAGHPNNNPAFGGAANLVANGKAHVDIFSFALRYRFDVPKASAIVTKG